MPTIEPRTSVVRIYQGDYLDRIRHIERQYEAAVQAEKDAPPLLNGDASRVAELAAEHAELVAEADKSSIDVTVKALGRRKWRDLVAQYPPREGNREDLSAGVNLEAFAEPLVKASIVSPEFTDDELDQISDVDFNRLEVASWALNRLPGMDPKGLTRPDLRESRESDGN